MDKEPEELIGRILGALGERPSVEQSAQAQTLLLAEILRELSRLKAEVRRMSDEDDSDDRNDDDKEDDDRDEDDRDDDSDDDRRGRRGGRDDD
jgi:hypothetical protein